MKRIILFSCIIIVFSAQIAYALGDGSSCSTDMPAASGIVDFQAERGASLIATAGFENIIEKPLKGDDVISVNLEGNWYLVGLGYRIANRFEPYLRVGVSEMNVSWTENNNLIEVTGEKDFAIGGGLKILVHKMKLTNLLQLKLNLDGQMRYTQPNIREITIAGASSRNISAKEFRIIDARAAATIGLEISLKKILGEDIFEEGETDFYLVPYVGILYSDSLVRTEFKDSETQYSITESRDKDKFDLIAGIDIVTPKYVLLNLEAQFFDGESISGGASVKF